MFGLTSQTRRAAVSVASNIVEGCGRDSTAEFGRFLSIAYASAKELQYQISLARRLDFMEEKRASAVEQECDELCRMLNTLMRKLRIDN